MNKNVMRCGCTNAAAADCTGTAFTWLAPFDDGSCGCVCHIEYSDDPEHWQPYVYNPVQDAADDILGWYERLDAAEALTEEPGL